MTYALANKIVDEILSHIPDEIRRDVAAGFPLSKVRIKIDQGFTENQLLAYAKNIFNTYYINTGEVETRYAFAHVNISH